MLLTILPWVRAVIVLYYGDLATFSTSLNKLKARLFVIALAVIARNVEALQVQMQSTTQCRSRNRLVSRPFSVEWPVLGNSTQTLVNQLITVVDSQPSAVKWSISWRRKWAWLDVLGAGCFYSGCKQIWCSEFYHWQERRLCLWTTATHHSPAKTTNDNDRVYLQFKRLVQQLQRDLQRHLQRYSHFTMFTQSSTRSARARYTNCYRDSRETSAKGCIVHW